MINTDKLLGVFAENHKSKKDVANMLGITPKTLYLKMEKGVFGSDEIQIMIDEMNISDPMSIFFVQE